MMNDECMSGSSEPWVYDGRYYQVVKFSDVNDRDGYGWELEDLAPSPVRGPLLEVFLDDTSRAFTFRAFTDQPLPVDLVHRLVTEAMRDVSLME